MFILNMLTIYTLPAGLLVFKAFAAANRDLIMTLAVAIITMVVFGVTAFYNFTEMVTCEGVSQCVQLAVLYSFTADMQSMFHEESLKIHADAQQLTLVTIALLVFFLLFILIWKYAIRDIAQGLIVDAYSSIREEKREVERDRLDKCFICSRSRFLFEMEASGFEAHQAREHNIFAYLDYFLGVHLSTHRDLDGIQAHVLAEVVRCRSDFLPFNRAISLEQHDRLNNVDHAGNYRHLSQGLDNLHTRVKTQETQIHELFNKLEKQLGDLTSRVDHQALQADTNNQVLENMMNMLERIQSLQPSR